ncbi:MAG: type VI secretion system protein TssA [Acidobacteriia bacterium]|nr:type VI secretion system protein TssA [Terriglobia bacterium]
MPLPNELLNPISPENPSGRNLKYDPLYDKIKEARREDDDVAQGEWQLERKLADWTLTIKLITEALATKTKDVQLAVWLAQALLRREGFTGFRDGLNLIHQLLETFWDSIYPEIEDGDPETRVGPLEWLATEPTLPEKDRPATAVKLAPITEGGLAWVHLDETRQVGTEEAAADSYEKQQARAAKIAEGKTPPEKFDKDFDATSKTFYVDLERTLDETLESISRLSQFCDEKFGDLSPSFGDLKKGVEEVRLSVHTLLLRKREKEPDAGQAAGATEAAEPAKAEAAPEAPQAPVGQGAPAPARKPAAIAALPESWEDAVARVVAVARFMRQQNPYSPAPYLMLRGLRWGELRASPTSIDQTKLVAPPSETRQALKRATMDSNWQEVLDMAETAMGMEYGRGWLDLQRYVTQACQKLGGYYEPVRRAVVAELQSLLETYPQLLEMTLMDDTPAANADTQAWLKKQVLSRSAGSRTNESGGFSRGRYGITPACSRPGDGGSPFRAARGGHRIVDARNCPGTQRTRPLPAEGSVGASLPARRE